MNHSSSSVILASQSPRRIELLKQVITDFKVIPSEVEEILRPDRSPEENAEALGLEKANWVAKHNPGHWVIGADTVVVLDEEIIGKPTDDEDARRILKRLSGREHQVVTGVAVVHLKTASTTTVSRVRIKPLTHEEIVTYVDSGEPLDKAGAYAIQGKGASLVDGFDGSYTNIIGLPIETLKDLLQQAGYPDKLTS